MPTEPYVRIVAEGVYDMIYSDSDEDWCVCTDSKAETGAAYFEDFKEVPKELYGMDMDGGSRPHQWDGEVCFGRQCGNAVIRGVTQGEAVSIILDSGADMSVLPLSYKDCGKSSCAGQCSA